MMRGGLANITRAACQFPPRRRRQAERPLRVAEPVRNREAPVATERPWGDLHPWWGLTPLVLVAVHHRDVLPDRRLLVPECDDISQGSVLLDIRLENGVEHLI